MMMMIIIIIITTNEFAVLLLLLLLGSCDIMSYSTFPFHICCRIRPRVPVYATWLRPVPASEGFGRHSEQLSACHGRFPPQKLDDL